MKSAAVKYGVTAALAAAVTAGHLALHGYAAAATAEERARILCDAFTVPGLLLLLLGALVALSNAGSFDAVSYAVRYAFRRLLPGPGGPDETYAEYVERRREQGRVRGYGFLLHVGMAFFAVALALLLRYLTL